MRVNFINAAIEDVPVDLFADPDGFCDYDDLARACGFDQGWGQLSVGALMEPFEGFPSGAAVVMFAGAEDCRVALVDCLSSQTAAA
jgi:hypothetical protein